MTTAWTTGAVVFAHGTTLQLLRECYYDGMCFAVHALTLWGHGLPVAPTFELLRGFVGRHARGLGWLRCCRSLFLRTVLSPLTCLLCFLFGYSCKVLIPWALSAAINGGDDVTLHVCTGLEKRGRAMRREIQECFLDPGTGFLF